MIVILTQCFPPALGGIENLMGEAARSLTARGHRVVVLADGHKGRVADSAGFGDVRYFGGLRLWRRWRKAGALRRLLADTPADAVLADSWKSVETLVRSGAINRAGNIVCYAHGNEFPEQPSADKARRISRALAHVARVIANSRFTAERVKRYAPSDTLVVRAPPVAPAEAYSSDDRAWAQSLWGKGSPRLLSLSRLEPLKGVDRAISAIAVLVERYPSLRYVVAGAGGDLDRLKALVSEHGLGAHVVFAGPVLGSRKSALYESADLFVMPTRREGLRQEAFGMVYLEAALHGLPVIGGRAGGADEAVLDGRTGLLVDGDDASAVVAALDALLADGAMRHAMGESARAFGNRFTWPAQIAALEQDLLKPAE